MKKKTMKKTAAGGKKKTRASKSAPVRSVGDRLFEKNLAALYGEMETVIGETTDDMPKYAPRIVRRLREEGVEISPEMFPQVIMGIWSIERLCVLTAEMRTLRQILEGKLAE